MKNLKNLGKTLNKNEQREINGGLFHLTCHPGGDAICCGNNLGQCSTGPFAGGIFLGYNRGRINCACF